MINPITNNEANMVHKIMKNNAPNRPNVNQSFFKKNKKKILIGLAALIVVILAIIGYKQKWFGKKVPEKEVEEVEEADEVEEAGDEVEEGEEGFKNKSIDPEGYEINTKLYANCN